MPPKKKTTAQLQQLQNAHSNSPAIRTDFEARLAQCQNELAEAMSEIETLKSEIETLRSELSQAQDKCTVLEGLQENSAEKICDLKAQVLAEKNTKQIYIGNCAMNGVLASML